MARASFTPSLLPGDTLERLFVAREELLNSIVGRVRRAAESAERSHTLLVGPRGAGKTHLLSLVHHRAIGLPGYGSDFALSWLEEDPWGIQSLDDLLEAIDVQREVAPATALTVVLLENLDQILAELGDEGQRRLRRRLENDADLLLVGTATRLTAPVIAQSAPFYGFFTTSELQAFSVAEATQMLVRLAEEADDLPLAHRLSEPPMRARIAAVAHLAGGQPRVWSLLAEGLSLDSAENVSQALVERFDDLTPFYQERMARLSARERRVVRALADADRPLSVKALATVTGVEQRSLAGTIGDLRKTGWVRPLTGPLVSSLDQRLTYYELAEPLARLAFQLKASRGKPVRLVLDFLTTWFSAEELQGWAPAHAGAKAYADEARALSLSLPTVLLQSVAGSRVPAVEGSAPRWMPRLPSPDLAMLLMDLESAVASFTEDEDATALLDGPSAVRVIVEEQLAEVGAARTRLALLLHARDAGAAPDRAVSAAERAARPAADDVNVLGALALVYAATHRTQEVGSVLARLHQAVDVLVDVLPEVAARGQEDVALATFAATSATGHELLRLAMALDGSIGVHEEVTMWDLTRRRLADHAEAELVARSWLAPSLTRVGRYDDAVGLAETVLRDLQVAYSDLSREVATAQSNLAAAYLYAGRPADAAVLSERALKTLSVTDGAEHPATLAAMGNAASTLAAAGRFDEARALHEHLLTLRIRTLGDSHPHTSGTRSNLASLLQDEGFVDDAVFLFERVVADSGRVLGPEHPQTLTYVSNLALAFESAGRDEEAQVMWAALAIQRTRVLGKEHPVTVATQLKVAAMAS